MLRGWKSGGFASGQKFLVRFKSAATSFPRVREETWDATNHVVRSPYDVQLSDLNLSDFIWRNVGRHLELPAMVIINCEDPQIINIKTVRNN